MRRDGDVVQACPRESNASAALPVAEWVEEWIVRRGGEEEGELEEGEEEGEAWACLSSYRKAL